MLLQKSECLFVLSPINTKQTNGEPVRYLSSTSDVMNLNPTDTYPRDKRYTWDHDVSPRVGKYGLPPNCVSYNFRLNIFRKNNLRAP